MKTACPDSRSTAATRPNGNQVVRRCVATGLIQRHRPRRLPPLRAAGPSRDHLLLPNQRASILLSVEETSLLMKPGCWG